MWLILKGSNVLWAPSKKIKLINVAVVMGTKVRVRVNEKEDVSILRFNYLYHFLFGVRFTQTDQGIMIK